MDALNGEMDLNVINRQDEFTNDKQLSHTGPTSPDLSSQTSTLSSKSTSANSKSTSSTLTATSKSTSASSTISSISGVSDTTPFLDEDYDKVSKVKAWVEAHKAAGIKVTLVFVNGVLHDDKPPPFLDVLENYFEPDNSAWKRNVFLSIEFVTQILSGDIADAIDKVSKGTGNPSPSVSDVESAIAIASSSDTAFAAGAALLATALAADVLLNNGQGINACANAVVSHVPRIPELVKALNHNVANEIWGENGDYMKAVQKSLQRDTDRAYLFVGHSFGAVSLATARPYFSNEKGFAMLLLGSPEVHTDIETPLGETDPNPVYAITHCNDFVRLFSDISDLRDLGHDKSMEDRVLNAEAHSLATYSQLFAPSVEEVEAVADDDGVGI
jgi:hypothetical protein